MTASDISGVIHAIAAVATAIGVVLAYIQLRHTRSTAVAQFEDALTGQYRAIIKDLPVVALLRRPLTPAELDAALPAFFRYFDLTNEQAYLKARGRIADATWSEWSDGINQNMKLPAFAAAWMQIRALSGGDPDSFSHIRDALPESFPEASNIHPIDSPVSTVPLSPPGGERTKS